MNALEIVLERDTANDEFATVAVVLVPSGSAVLKDQPIFEIENSKATEEYVAPGDGTIIHELVAGQSVHFGVAIARILPAGRNASDEFSLTTSTRVIPPASPTPAEIVTRPAVEPTHTTKARFSSAAAAPLVKLNLSASQFDADFVTSDDVLAHLACEEALRTSPLSRVTSVPLEPVQAPASSIPSASKKSAVETPAGLPVGQRKRAEIDVLSQGAGQTMLSVLGVHLGQLLVRRGAGDFLEGRITDLVLYESSRLMRKYPKLNAFYSDGQIFLHESVHAGLAIDDGGRLMVYGLERSDQTGLPELGEQIADAVARYVNNELTPQELTRATYTVTDLSAGELDFVLPLLPRGQSCIVGITSSAASGYRLFAGFDHRVTEGREVTAFLGELRDRLLSFSVAGLTATSASVCAFCARSSTEAVLSSKEKGLLRVVDRQGNEVLCCGSCWNGW